MPIKRIDVNRWAKEQRALAQEFMPAALRGCESAAYRAAALLVTRTRQAPPANPDGKGSGGAVNTGQFLRAWRSKRLIGRGARVFNDAGHAAIVEGGRRPGKAPPREVIVRWAQRRLGLSEREARAAAWPIARAIAKRGLRGREIMKGATDEITMLATEEIDRELQAAIRRR